MKRRQILGRLALLWLVLSLVGVLTPLWSVAALVYLRRRCTRIYAGQLAALAS